MNIFDHVVDSSKKFDDQRDVYEAFGGMGKAYWLTGKGKLYDISSDMGGGTDDHVGFFAIAEQEVPVEDFGITKEEALAMHDAYLNGEFTDVSVEAQYKILRSGAIRIRVYPETFVALSDKRDSKTRNRLIDFMLEKKIKRDEILWEDSDQSMKEYTYTDFMGMNESLEGLDDIIQIQKSEPSCKTDPYMRGLLNALIVAKATVTDDPEPVKLMGPDGEIDEAQTLTKSNAGMGLIQYSNDKIALVGGMKTAGLSRTDTHAKLRWMIFVIEGEKKVGYIDMSWSYEKQAPVGIVDLKLEKQYRGQGIGAEVVQALKATFPQMKIHDIKKGAVGFWKKQGAMSLPQGDSRGGKDMQFESVNEEIITHSYSNVQIAAPHDVAQKVVQFGLTIPDEEIYTDQDDPSMGRELIPHITVKWGLLTEDPNEVESLIEDDAQAFGVVLGKVSVFENSDKPYDVVKIDVEGGEYLQYLYTRLSSLENRDDNPQYVPHMTIAYVKKGAGEKYKGDGTFVGVEFGVECV